MSTNPEVKAAKAQAAADKAQERADRFESMAGNEDEQAAAAVAELPDIVKDFEVIRDGKLTQRVVINFANGDRFEFLQVDPEAFKRLVTASQGTAKKVDHLTMQVRKGFQGAAKKAKTFMVAWKQLSATVDRLKGYHDDLDGEVNSYKADADSILGIIYETMGPALDDINRLDKANPTLLAGSRLVSALGKTSMATGMGKQLYDLVALGIRAYAYTTPTGSAFSADEDAIPAANQTGNAGAGLLSWLLGQRAAATPAPAADAGVEVG